jgi:hypothetical protein
LFSFGSGVEAETPGQLGGTGEMRAAQRRTGQPAVRAQQRRVLADEVATAALAGVEGGRGVVGDAELLRVACSQAHLTPTVKFAPKSSPVLAAAKGLSDC